MCHPYASNRVHVIFSTKDRKRCLTTELQPRLWAYMAGVAQKQGFTALIIGGVEDHVHALIALPSHDALVEGDSIPQRQLL